MYLDVFVNSNKFCSIILKYLFLINDLFKNNVVVYVIIGLNGVFVFFFVIFVFIYIYFKCFWKKIYKSRMEGNEW